MIALWDLGNVVVQWNPQDILRRLQLPEDKAEQAGRLLNGGELWLDLDRGVTDEATVAEQICSVSDLTTAEMHRCFDVVRESLVDFPESVKLINQMRDAGIPMYVLSNMSLVNAQYLRTRDYFEWFDGVVISAEEKLIKPDPALFKRVIDRYRLNPHEIVFIDDSLPNIEAAKALGMNTVHFHATERCYQRIREYFAELPG